MQTLNLNNPSLPDLQFVLLVGALCTSEMSTLNAPEEIRRLVFDRCWALLHDIPPPNESKQRVLDLRQGDAVTLEALVEMIQRTFAEHGYDQLTWDHDPSEPTQSTSPDAQPLIDRLRYWDPLDSPPVDGSADAGNN